MKLAPVNIHSNEPNELVNVTSWYVPVHLNIVL